VGHDFRGSLQALALTADAVSNTCPPELGIYASILKAVLLGRQACLIVEAYGGIATASSSEHAIMFSLNLPRLENPHI
jgi:hypothetical protein